MSEKGPTGHEEERSREVESRPRPRVYVASLSDYNAGRLHGEWLDADQDTDALLAAVTQMLAGSLEPLAEEWAIHDYEGFGGVRLSEYEALETVSRIARGIVEHGPAFRAWAAALDDWESLDQFEDHYLGHWDSVTEYAEDLLDGIGLSQIIEQAVPETLRPYVAVDAENFGRDLVLGGDVQEVEDPEGGVFLFSP